MTLTKQLFGGKWTEEKLQALREYLVPYARIMAKHRFRFAYIDAFAGTGYRQQGPGRAQSAPLFPHLAEDESERYLEGSARIALEIEPSFTKYIFIEKSKRRCKQLEKLRAESPSRAERIEIVPGDCNVYLQDLCLKRNWSRNRAVLFLDPFGMQVEWKTVEAVAQTRAIDTLILFPLGVAVNRLLKKDGKTISDSWRKRLDGIFGTADWYKTFYAETTEQGLFGTDTRTTKIATLQGISAFYVERLRAIFSEVVDRPKPLLNSKGMPLFHLCFAAGNPVGAKTAVKIARHILET